MASYFGQMLIAIQERMAEMVPEVKWTDQDFGQLEAYEGERPPVLFPCVLIDFDETQYNQDGQLEETGEPLIIFKLGFAPFSASNSATPILYRQKALAFYDIENDIYKAFKGWCPASEICQPLNRVSAATQKGREDTFRVRLITFSTSFQDSEASPVYTKENPDLELINE